jgi:DNA-binding SARP family transcriptional activator
MKLSNTAVLSATDLTDNQRQLLALLIAAPNQALPIEDAQTTLWPDSPAQKARSNIDNLIFRLRKTIDSALGELAVKPYLLLKHGMLMLTNCRIDIIPFREKSRVGLNHLRRNQFWQAGNALRPALELWQGDFIPGVPLNESGEQARHDLKLLGANIALQLAQMNAAADPVAARRIAAAALHHDPTNEDLVRCLYNLYAAANDAVNAAQVLKRYTNALSQHGFSTDEIDDSLNSFWKKPSC